MRELEDDSKWEWEKGSMGKQCKEGVDGGKSQGGNGGERSQRVTKT